MIQWNLYISLLTICWYITYLYKKAQSKSAPKMLIESLTSLTLSGWTHPRLNRGGATLNPDKIHCSWSYGGEEEVDWCSQWIPRIPMPGPVFLSWSSFQLRSTFRLLRRHLAPAWNKEGSNQLAQIEFCIYPDVSLVCKVLSPILTKTLKSNGQTIFCKDKNIEDMQSSQLSGYHRNSLCFKIIYVSEKFKNPWEL